MFDESGCGESGCWLLAMRLQMSMVRYSMDVRTCVFLGSPFDVTMAISNRVHVSESKCLLSHLLRDRLT